MLVVLTILSQKTFNFLAKTLCFYELSSEKYVYPFLTSILTTNRPMFFNMQYSIPPFIP